LGIVEDVKTISDSVHLRCFMMDTLVIPKDTWNAQNVQSPFWRLYCNADAGAFIVLADGTRFSFAPHTVYLIPAGVYFSCGNDKQFTHFYIHFDIVGIPRLTLKTLFEHPVAIPNTENPPLAERILSFAQTIAHQPTLTLAHQCQAKAFLYESIGVHLAHISEERLAISLARAEACEPVAPALEYIENHLDTPLHLSDLASSCFLSPDYFGKRFKECVGQTPIEYIQERRILEAAQRLLFSTESIENIASSCGFGNRFYLTRLFTKQMGVPPATYRKGYTP
jgi:AraC-like DNA-binding protein